MIQSDEVYVQNEIEIILDAHHGVTQNPSLGDNEFYRSFVVQSTTPYDLVSIHLWMDNDIYLISWWWDDHKANSGNWRVNANAWLVALQTLFEAVFETQRGDHL